MSARICSYLQVTFEDTESHDESHALPLSCLAMIFLLPLLCLTNMSKMILPHQLLGESLIDHIVDTTLRHPAASMPAAR